MEAFAKRGVERERELKTCFFFFSFFVWEVSSCLLGIVIGFSGSRRERVWTAAAGTKPEGG